MNNLEGTGQAPKQLGLTSLGNSSVTQLQQTIEMSLQPGTIVFSQPESNGSVIVSTGRTSGNEDLDGNTYLESLGFTRTCIVKAGEEEWEKVDFTKNFAAYKEPNGDIILYTINEKEDTTAKDLVSTLNNGNSHAAVDSMPQIKEGEQIVLLDCDEHLQDLIYQNKLPISQQIQDAIRNMIEHNKSGELVLCNWYQEKSDGGRQPRIPNIVLDNPVFIKVSNINLKEEGHPRHDTTKNKITITLGLYETGINESGNKIYNISPHAFQDSGKGAMMAGFNFYTQNISAEMFENIIKNPSSRDIKTILK